MVMLKNTIKRVHANVYVYLDTAS